MVTFVRLFKRVVLFPFLSLVCLVLLAGCGTGAKVSLQPDFKPPADLDTVYVAPFVSTLVPVEVAETVFNDFVDILNENRAQARVKQFEILKGDSSELDKAWLSRQLSISGELWSYIEFSGCCQTELRIRSRVALTEPGKQMPTAEIFLPLDGFFDHDQSTLDKERLALARRVARQLADRVVTALTSRR